MPNIGDIKRASEVGYSGRAKFTWRACPDCGIERWSPLSNPITRCWVCAARLREQKRNPITFTGGREPKIGDTANPATLGLSGRAVCVFTPCLHCGIPRWVRKGVIDNPCVRCAAIGKHREELSGRWKGGTKRSRGYVYVPIYAGDLLFVMATKNGRKRGLVAEHRLVVARHLGRLLSSDEVIHHINGVKDDNRIDNLQLLSKNSHHSHLVPQKLQHTVQSLEKRVTLLEAENVILRAVVQGIRDSISSPDPNIRCYNTPGDCLDKAVEGIVHTSSNRGIDQHESA